VRLMAGRTEWKAYLHEEGQWRQVAGEGEGGVEGRLA